MAITYQKSGIGINQNGDKIGYKDYRGLSTDTKPTNTSAINDLFLELDTGNVFYFDGSDWQSVGGDA